MCTRRAIVPPILYTLRITILSFVFGVPDKDIEHANDQQLDALIQVGGVAAKQATQEKRFRRQLLQQRTQYESLLSIMQTQYDALQQEIEAQKQELDTLKHKWETPVDAQSLEHAGEEDLRKWEQAGGQPAIQALQKRVRYAEYFQFVLEREQLICSNKPCAFVAGLSLL